MSGNPQWVILRSGLTNLSQNVYDLSHPSNEVTRGEISVAHYLDKVCAVCPSIDGLHQRAVWSPQGVEPMSCLDPAEGHPLVMELLQCCG